MASAHKRTPTRTEVDMALRVLSASLSALVDMVTSKQTKIVAVPGSTFSLEIPAKFNQIPAFLYFVAALSVACLYSIITALVSLSVILKPAFPKSCLLLLAFWDEVSPLYTYSKTRTHVGKTVCQKFIDLAKIVAHYAADVRGGGFSNLWSGAVAYIGLKGNNHAGWAEICSVYDRFCRHVGSETAISLFASILLVLLSVLSTYTLYKRVHD